MPSVKSLKIAVFSDSHCTLDDSVQNRYFRNFIADLNNIQPDYVMACGDLVSRNKPEYYQTFWSMIQESNLQPLKEKWRLIPGDHDRRDDGFSKENFENILGYRTYYKTRIGNIFFLHMGNKHRSGADWSAKEWWW